MGYNKNPRIKYHCDYCGVEATDKPSAYKKKKRHFCSQRCYSKFRAELLPKEEQHRYGSGNSLEERAKRRKARSILNHYLRDKKLARPLCHCGKKAEAHHDDYDKPLDVRWLCFKHHREWHKKIYENPEFLKCYS